MVVEKHINFQEPFTPRYIGFFNLLFGRSRGNFFIGHFLVGKHPLGNFWEPWWFRRIGPKLKRRRRSISGCHKLATIIDISGSHLWPYKVGWPSYPLISNSECAISRPQISTNWFLCEKNPTFPTFFGFYGASSSHQAPGGVIKIDSHEFSDRQTQLGGE